VTLAAAGVVEPRRRVDRSSPRPRNPIAAWGVMVVWRCSIEDNAAVEEKRARLKQIWAAQEEAQNSKVGNQTSGAAQKRLSKSAEVLKSLLTNQNFSSFKPQIKTVQPIGCRRLRSHLCDPKIPESPTQGREFRESFRQSPARDARAWEGASSCSQGSWKPCERRHEGYCWGFRNLSGRWSVSI